jgi:hypothetical protein
MLFTLVFVLIFLIGFALFAALLGSSFLGKHAKRVEKKRGRPSRERMLSEREIGQRFRREFEEGLEEERALQPAAAAPAVYAPPVGPTKRTGMWVLVSLGIAAVLAVSFYFGYGRVSEFLKRPRLIFCEGVDYVKLRPIRSSNTFTRGNVTVFVKSGGVLDTQSATVEIFRVGQEGPEYFDRRTIPIRPHWTSFSIKALFDRIGSYSVKVLEEDGDLLAEKVIYIVPDSYAYRPVAGP